MRTGAQPKRVRIRHGGRRRRTMGASWVAGRPPRTGSPDPQLMALVAFRAHRCRGCGSRRSEPTEQPRRVSGREFVRPTRHLSGCSPVCSCSRRWCSPPRPGSGRTETAFLHVRPPVAVSFSHGRGGFDCTRCLPVAARVTRHAVIVMGSMEGWRSRPAVLRWLGAGPPVACGCPPQAAAGPGQTAVGVARMPQVS